MATAAPINTRIYGCCCCCCPYRYTHSWRALMATVASIDIRTHGYCCPHRDAHLWRAIMATTAPIDMRTHVA